ncbi:MAG: PulJ/GspJ family protein [Planctomycetota bacterium]
MAAVLPHRVPGAHGRSHDGGSALTARQTVRTDRIAFPGLDFPGKAFPVSGARRRSAGFSLVELLIAMAIFSVLGLALIALLRQSTVFLEQGQSGSERYDMLETADRIFQDDLVNLYSRPSTPEGEPDVRLYSDFVGWDTDADKVMDTETQRLAFVRSIRGEVTDPMLRRAGSKPGATGRVDGTDDEKERSEFDHRAAGGKQEVMFLLVPGKAEDEPGVGALYRGSRTPIGGRDSYLPWEPLDSRVRGKTRSGIHTLEEAKKAGLRPVLNGVLHLSFHFWSRHTRPGDAELVKNGAIKDDIPPELGGGGLSRTWDSTRGILPLGARPDQFFLAKGSESLAYPTDDVFPRRIRVVMVVDRIGIDANTGELTRDLGPDDTTIHVDTTKFAPSIDPVSRFIKIGNEWIQWSDRDGKTFTVEKRGVRGTKRGAHPSGDLVRAGATLVREYDIPAFREDWND